MVNITYLEGYTKRKSITIDHTKVAADLSYFPALVKITNDTGIGASALSTGYDLRFTASDGTTILAYERESFSIVDGSCNALIWVKIPSLSSTVDTVIYLYYGNPGATDGQNKTGVWDDGGSNYFKGVWHFNNDPTGTAPQILDSTSNGYNGTVSGDVATIAGRIGNGLSFDGTGDYIDVGTMSAASSDMSLVTVSAWVKSSTTNSVMALCGTLNATTTQAYFKIGLNADPSNGGIAAGKIQFYLRSNSGSNFSGGVNSNTGITDGNLHHIIITLDKANLTATVTIDDSAKTVVNNSSTDGTSWVEWSRSLLIGAVNEASVVLPFIGTIDEMRIATGVIRSAGWGSTEYNNQSVPSSFLLIGIEETDSEEPPIYFYPILEFNEENEMQQIAGTTKSHPVQIRSLTSPGDIVTEITDTPVFTVKKYSTSGITKTTPELTYGSYDMDTMEFSVTIPDTLATTAGDGILVNVSCNAGDGQGTFYVNVVSDPATFALASALTTVDGKVDAIKAITDILTADPLTAIKTQATEAISEAALATAAGLSAVGGNVDLIKTTTDLLTADPLAAIKAQAASALSDFDTATPIAKTSELSGLTVDLSVITGGGTATLDSLESDIAAITGGSSAEKVIHPDYYAFDASEKTITLSSPYDVLTVEQVLRIKDLTTNYLIYDCEDSKYDDIPVSIVGGVLTYTAPARDAADTDLLQITVNMV